MIWGRGRDWDGTEGQHFVLGSKERVVGNVSGLGSKERKFGVCVHWVDVKAGVRTGGCVHRVCPCTALFGRGEFGAWLETDCAVVKARCQVHTNLAGPRNHSPRCDSCGPAAPEKGCRQASSARSCEGHGGHRCICCLVDSRLCPRVRSIPGACVGTADDPLWVLGDGEMLSHETLPRC